MTLTYKTFATDIKADPTPDVRRMTFTISTGTVDRDGDILDPGGWDTSQFMTNPVVLFAHDYHSLPVAKAVGMSHTDTALIATTEFPAKGTYAFADTVYDMLKSGFLNATSVGFKPTDSVPLEKERGSGFHHRKNQLMEFSIVPIPSNPEALVSQRSAAPEQVKAWTKELRTWVDAHEPAALKAIFDWVKRTGKTLRYEEDQFIGFEKDYLVESDEGKKTLTYDRLEKLFAIHEMKDGTSGPESQDHTQAAALRLVHHAAMDAYANAHHADAVMTSIATMEANIPTDGKGWEDFKAASGKLRQSMTQAHGAIKRARDHAMDAAEKVAAMGGKAWMDKYVIALTKPMPVPNAGESQSDFISRCAGNATMNSDYPDNAQRVAVCHSQWDRHKREAEPQTKDEPVLDLLDDDPNSFEIDEGNMATLIAELMAGAVAAETRAAVNAALGRLD